MKGIGFRHFLVLLVFLGLVITYMLRVNLSVAILAMVNNTALAEARKPTDSWKNISASSGGCSATPSNTTAPTLRDGQFVWDAKTRGFILGPFFYGYIVMEIPGGWLSYRFGGKWIFGLGMLWTAIFTLLTPLTAHLNLPLLIVIRILEGMGEGLALPCVHGLFAQWVPPSERSRMPAITLAGLGIGTLIAFPFSAALCDSEIGWPLLFYVFGAIGVAWFILWAIFGSSTPATSRWISDQERIYIQKSLAETVVEGERASCSTIPFCAIAKTPAVWAVLLSHMSFSWGQNTLITLLPSFYSNVLNMDMAKNGTYSALPYICFTVVAIANGHFTDYLIGRRILSVTMARKIMDGIGLILPGIFLLLTTTIGCDTTAAVILMCLAIGSQGFIGAGSYSNNLDLSGRFAGVTYSVFNTLGSVCGVVAPVLAGVVTQQDNKILGWRIVFGITAGFFWIAALVFIAFGRGETAEWARIDREIDDKKTVPSRSHSTASANSIKKF